MRTAWALAMLLLAPALVSASEAPAEPAEGWWEDTRLDEDRDGVDDALAPLLSTSAPLVVLLDYASMPTEAQKAAVRARGVEIVQAYGHFPILAVRALPAQVPGLATLPGVVLVEKDDVLTTQLKESVPLLGVPQAIRTYQTTGKGVVVAVLDDGSFDQHPDLRQKVAAAYDAGGGTGGPASEGSPVTLVAPASEDGHATHVAGTILGGGDQSGGTYRGVAPGARYVNVKVFTGPNQTSSTLVLKGLDWVLDQQDALGIRVATMSLGGRASDGKDAISRAVNVAVDKGLVVVAAAGNGGPGPETVSSPGAAAKAITVGAVDKRKGVATFSARGPTLDGRLKPDVAAPGVGIVSTVPPNKGSGASVLETQTLFYGPLSGTSMAAPHVSGVVALMLEANPSLSPQQVKQMLMVTAQDIGAPGADNETGYGFVNAIAAVQVAKDPSILESPQFRAKLAAIPDPPEESFLSKLSYEMESMGRSGALVFYGVLALAVAGVLVAGTFILRRRAARDGAPPPSP